MQSDLNHVPTRDGDQETVPRHSLVLAQRTKGRYSGVMRAVTSESFGLLIAYVLPGFVLLWGLGHVSPTVALWLGTSAQAGPTVGGFLYVTLGSVAAGLTVSTLRWLVIDTIHHRTGIEKPEWDFSLLQSRTAAFETLIEIHYRYYQAYANGCLAVAIAFGTRWISTEFHIGEFLVVVIVEALFFIGSRDTLAKYIQRVAAVLKGA